MKREDFKEITKKHILACDWIIKENGKCIDIQNCSDCPFYFRNSAYTDSVSDCLGYTGVIVRNYENPQLMESAKEFLELFEEDFVEDKKSSEVDNDKINSPRHYRLSGLNIESIDIIRAILGKFFKWFCLGNIIKYIIRAEKKNGLEDYKKARKYLDWLIEGEEEKEVK